VIIKGADIVELKHAVDDDLKPAGVDQFSEFGEFRAAVDEQRR
jgi:hypothetical protein